MNVRHVVRLLLFSLTLPLSAAPIPVQYTLGAMRGFLAIRSASGTLIGHGEYVQSAAGDRVTTRLTLHFRDGSLDDETAVFTQRGTFRFVSDHHIQRGPFFKNGLDFTLEANGNATIRTTDHGQQKTETSHFDLPPDTANGVISAMLLNFPRNMSATSFGMVLPTTKGRLAKLDVTRDGTQTFSAVAGDRITADIFRIKIALGGLAGVVAPIVGKQPSDIFIWIAQGEIPVFVREVGQLSDGGPVISLELAGTSFSRASTK